MIFLIQLVFQAYTILIAARIVGSWFPSFARSKVMRYIAVCTDPYLNIFRKLIPPIGGMFDLSPILGYLGIQLVEKLLMKVLL